MDPYYHYHHTVPSYSQQYHYQNYQMSHGGHFPMHDYALERNMPSRQDPHSEYPSWPSHPQYPMSGEVFRPPPPAKQPFGYPLQSLGQESQPPLSNSQQAPLPSECPSVRCATPVSLGTCIPSTADGTEIPDEKLLCEKVKSKRVISRSKKGGRGGNSTCQLPKHPDPQIEKKREGGRVNNRIYQSKSRKTKDAELKSALNQLGMVWEFLHSFQNVEKARNERFIQSYCEQMKAENSGIRSGPEGETASWYGWEDGDYEAIKRTVMELQKKLGKEKETLEKKKTDILEQEEQRKRRLKKEKGLEEEEDSEDEQD